MIVKPILAVVNIIPYKNETTQFSPSLTVGSLVSSLLKNIYTIAGLVFLAMIVYGGFMILSSAGGDPKKMQQGQQLLFNAIIGFVIIFVSVAIVKIVELFTGFSIL